MFIKSVYHHECAESVFNCCYVKYVYHFLDSHVLMISFKSVCSRLTFVRGCIIDNDSLLLLIDDNYNLQECHQQVMNVIPHDVEQNLVNVEYVSDNC